MGMKMYLLLNRSREHPLHQAGFPAREAADGELENQLVPALLQTDFDGWARYAILVTQGQLIVTLPVRVQPHRRHYLLTVYPGPASLIVPCAGKRRQITLRTTLILELQINMRRTSLI